MATTKNETSKNVAKATPKKAEVVVNTTAKKTVIVKKEAPKKVEIKAVDTKKVEEKKATKTATKAATVKKTTAKAAPKKATTAKKTATKTTPKKTTTAKKATTQKKAAALDVTVHVQYAGKSIKEDDILDKVINDYVEAGHTRASIKTIETYVKVEDNTAYYVVNETYRGHVVLD